MSFLTDRILPVLSHRGVTAWAAGLMIAGEVIWVYRWVVKDLAIRFLPGTHAYFTAEDIAFVRDVSWAQEAAFFAAAIGIVASLIFLLRRSKWVLPVYLATFLMAKLDWIFSAWSGFENQSASGYATMVYQALIIWLLIRLYQMGHFKISKRARPPS